ncbi:hypothetical protein RHSIM_Rhsim07G0197400 [Rhododendron simsii]|uniref:Gnk2-homologous domain-containing protein n=1 Tax=Rhododendron simsii TaxID=118357 RepID=A0A834GPQ6_RHOSS|nr:hypothetical protein RHSIM_Rhsim07G0197400 [Rhododendron simsii]
MGVSSLVLLPSCVVIGLLHPLSSAQYCSYPGNFTSNSIYSRNCDRILSFLPRAINDNHGFYISTLGQGSDTVYALALCRGDLSNQSCSNCVNLCSLAIIASCPNKIEAIDFGNPSQCIVRTSNKSLPASGNSSRKFATGEKNYTRYQNNTVYGLMQCVPSLSSVDCTRCLRGAVDDYQKFIPRKQAVIILRPSCIFQYDLSPFLESSAGAEPPPPAPPVAVTFAPPPSSTNLTRNEDNKSRTLQPTNIIVVAAWDLWREGKALDIVDSLLLGDGHESFLAAQMLRCIHIGLLCVEESATDRPTMSDVDFMLSNETALLPPKRPAFVMNSVKCGPGSSSTITGAAPSLNDVTISLINAR